MEHILKYEQIHEGTLDGQIEVLRIFEKNMERTEKLKCENKQLVTENYKLNEQNEELKCQLESSKNTLEVLEQKIGKVEAAALKSFGERNLETKTLKDALKKSNIEVETYKSDLKARNKTLKEKEKETLKLEKKNENLAENVKKLKVEISSSKQEIKKLENKQKTKTKKSQNVSTNTVPRSALFSETTTKCHLQNTSPPRRSLLHQGHCLPTQQHTDLPWSSS